MLNPEEYSQLQTRRQFLGRCGLGLGSIALMSLLKDEAAAGALPRDPMSITPPHFPAKAKRVVFLFMVGGPSHLDLFDHKPALNKREGEPVPESLIKGVKFAQIKEKQ